MLIGNTLMYFIVQKRDIQLIDHFISRGADKGKTLQYVAQLKDMSLLEKYFQEFKDQLNEDQYFLILRNTAQLNFVDGYRFLVNSNKFEKLDPVYKEDVSRIYYQNRQPASYKK
jgi:hypothetical protein